MITYNEFLNGCIITTHIVEGVTKYDVKHPSLPGYVEKADCTCTNSPTSVNSAKNRLWNIYENASRKQI